MLRHIAAVSGLQIRVAVEDQPAITAVGLHHVGREVGHRQRLLEVQQLGSKRRERIGHRADGGRQLYLVAVTEIVGMLDDGEPHALREVGQAADAERLADDQELIAAPADHDVRLSTALQQPVANLQQNAVAGRVTVGVVHPLEAVEVYHHEIQHGLLIAGEIHLGRLPLVG